MADIQKIAERPTPTNEDSVLEADFKIYTASIRTKRLAEHLQKFKHDQENPLLSHAVHQYTSTKSLATSPLIKRKMKQVYRAHSILHFLSSTPRGNLNKKQPSENTQNLEKTLNALRKTLEKAEKLHISINDSIQKHKQGSGQKASETELGYLSRLVMNKLYKMPLNEESSKAQKQETIHEINDIFKIINEQLLEDINVFLSIERTQTLRDKKMVTKTNKQINKLWDLQKVLFNEFNEPLQRQNTAISIRFQ